MAKFEVEGRSYNTEDFSDHQKGLISSLSVTKQLIKEIASKKDIYLLAKKEVEAVLKKEFGSKIREISDNIPIPQLKLENGKKIEFSEISRDLIKLVSDLGFLNQQISYFANQLQVLDTAKITYSKYFYDTIRETE